MQSNKQLNTEFNNTHVKLVGNVDIVLCLAKENGGLHIVPCVFQEMTSNYKFTALADIQNKFTVLECSSRSEENQATRARIGNTVSQVLFDLTTHTSSGESGVGDHGQDGIDTLIEQHLCTSHCESLALVPVSDQDNEEDDDE
ncbi:hypothetical protein C8R45DRAFT_927811 [Mycena sanguinolenta]|nr:hypothetical protein C8R45DRAFT_927811 [Mycena sanguinolenta]